MAGKRKRAAKKLEKTKVVISNDDKRKIADMIKEYPCLWDLADPLFKKTEGHLKYWEEIADKVGLSVEDCKTVWKSLRDGLRYRKINRPKGKSGDSGPDDSDLENEDGLDDDSTMTSWMFWDCMKFYAGRKSKRSTTSTMIDATGSGEREETDNASNLMPPKVVDPSSLVPDIQLQDSEAEVGLPRATPKSNYDYASRPKKQKPSEGTNATEKLATGISELISIRKNMQTNQREDRLVYHSMFSNLDRMLQKLPPNLVEDLNMEFIRLAYDAIKRQETIVFDP